MKICDSEVVNFNYTFDIYGMVYIDVVKTTIPSSSYRVYIAMINYLICIISQQISYVSHI